MKKVIVLILILSVASGCGIHRVSEHSKKQEIPQFLYHPPVRDLSVDLQNIFKCVKKVYSVSTYTTWQFSRSQNVDGYQIFSGRYKKIAVGVITTSETFSGTATVIGWEKKRVKLLTCTHIVHAQDTVISYFAPSGDDPVRYIQSISIKEKQENWIRDFSNCGSFPVTFTDNESDVAFLEKTCEMLPDTVPVLTCRWGDANLIGPGHFVYILGYPQGNPMITSGLTSPLQKRPFGEFTIDALLNKGYSGGIVLAIDQNEQFILTGIVERVSSENVSYLKPANDQLRTPDWIPYSGDAFNGNTEIINYGLNQIIPINKIRIKE